MGIIAWIIVGLVAGWLAEKIMGRDDSLITNLIIGIIGAFVGGAVMRWVFGNSGTDGWVASIVVATLGACLFLFLWGLISGRRRTV